MKILPLRTGSLTNNPKVITIPEFLIKNSGILIIYTKKKLLFHAINTCNQSLFMIIFLLSRRQAGVSEWQTRQTQNLLLATTYGFKSHRRHYKSLCIMHKLFSCLNILNLPVNRRKSVLFQKVICLLKMSAAKKTVVSRKGAWMNRLKYQVLRVVYKRFFGSCIGTP